MAGEQVFGLHVRGAPQLDAQLALLFELGGGGLRATGCGLGHLARGAGAGMPDDQQLFHA
ncbi:hypothetical protein D9M69_681720 [compost metagenome]